MASTEAAGWRRRWKLTTAAHCVVACCPQDVSSAEQEVLLLPEGATLCQLGITPAWRLQLVHGEARRASTCAIQYNECALLAVCTSIHTD